MAASPPTGFTVTHEPNGRFVLRDSDARERNVDIRSGVPQGLTIVSTLQIAFKRACVAPLLNSHQTYRSGDFIKEASDPPTPIARHKTRVRCGFDVRPLSLWPIYLRPREIS